jgi:hypothetical protein
VKQLLAAVLIAASSQAIGAQTISQRGFAEGIGAYFPQDAPNDPVNLTGDLLVREEIVIKPAPWIQFAAGGDLRANSHNQVDDSWRVDLSDRGRLRPALSVRRLSATISKGRLTLDAGKQFFRWGRTDIVTPTDWFAPRDFLNVIDNEFLPVTGIRAGVRLGVDTIEGVWDRFTPSRTPLVHQRWVVPPPGPPVTFTELDPTFPEGSQTGIRWSHAGSRLEYAFAFFNGFNHLPNIDLLPTLRAGEVAIKSRYPSLRSFGGDAAVPTPWFTLKVESAYFTSTTPLSDEYVLYVVQLERQSGEWSFVGGYAGEHVTQNRALLTFAPDRGLTRAIVGRASYTVDVNRSVAFEAAVRQNGDGEYLKVEYSQARGGHWRATLGGAVIRGEPDDFIGQYNRNSHVTLALRYSF